jgi:septal ring factor EnvC (AmiA/AmiB activator)
MIAKNDPAFLEASKNLYTLNGDETARAKCRARADYERLQNTYRIEMNQLRAEKELISAEKDQISAEKDQISKKNHQLSTENDALKKLLLENGITYTSPEGK